MNTLLKHSDMAPNSKEIAQFYLLPAHKLYLPLLPSCKALLPFDWYALRLPMRDRQVELTGWLVIY